MLQTVAALRARSCAVRTGIDYHRANGTVQRLSKFGYGQAPGTRPKSEPGGWAHCDAELVEISARRGYERGIWFPIKTGVQGLLVSDERGKEHVFIVCEPASREYAVMTNGRLMPVLIGERQ